MDLVERLTLEAARADTLLACEHRHRYQYATGLCAGRRVVDLCCGSGYGSEILAAGAETVVGVDNDAASIDAAVAGVGHRAANTSFECADAIAFLEGELDERFDVAVCFEGLEHLDRIDRALGLLRQGAERGLRIIASVPNSRLFGERNAFHRTDFGYDEALAAFTGFPSTVLVPQFLAEGSLICPPQARDTDVSLALGDRLEPESANHFLFCVNFDAGELHADHGRMHLSAAPVFNRYALDLEQANRALHRENARLARGFLGQAQSAAAAALAGVTPAAERLGAQLAQERHRHAETAARAAELRGALEAAQERRQAAEIRVGQLEAEMERLRAADPRAR